MLFSALDEEKIEDKPGDHHPQWESCRMPWKNVNCDISAKGTPISTQLGANDSVFKCFQEENTGWAPREGPEMGNCDVGLLVFLFCFLLMTGSEVSFLH